MPVKLTYLGKCDSLADVEEKRRKRNAEHAFGWVRIDFPKSKNRRCMVAWVPGRLQTEFGVWPVYKKRRPDLDGQTAWRWDGDAAEPTLHPSICQSKELGGKTYEIAHGFVTKGQWENC